MRSRDLPPREVQMTLLESFSDDYSEFVALGRRIGVDALNAVLETFGGQKPHVPQPASFWRGLGREVRNEEIRARFRGNNLGELMALYHLSERQIRNIVQTRQRRVEQRSAHTRPVQLSEVHYAAAAALAARHGANLRAMVDALIAVALGLPDLEKRLQAHLPQLRLMPAA